MKESDIRKYAELMQELGLTGLEITQDNQVVRLERTAAASEKTVPVIPVQKQPQEQPQDYISVKSPLVGLFYAAPAENAAPYVSVGDTVQKGQTLCIVEAMKLMNEIESDYDGKIAEICVENGQAVEYGQPLFRIV